MARRLYADFDAELRLRFANRSDITAAQRNFFLQDAYRQICMEEDHAELQGRTVEPLGLGLDELVPTVQDIWWPMYVRNLTDDLVIDLDDRERIELNAKVQGQPRRFYWYERHLVFDVLANGLKQIKIWYKRIPAELVTSPVIDSTWDPIIITRAARIGFDTVRDFEESSVQTNLEAAQRRDFKISPHMAKLNDSRQGFRVKIR